MGVTRLCQKYPFPYVLFYKEQWVVSCQSLMCYKNQLIVQGVQIKSGPPNESKPNIIHLWGAGTNQPTQWPSNVFETICAITFPVLIRQSFQTLEGGLAL